jgi:hypothetical protein
MVSLHFLSFMICKSVVLTHVFSIVFILHLEGSVVMGLR